MKGSKISAALLIGACVGAGGLSLLVFLLLWLLNPRSIQNSMGAWMLIFLFTVPLGGFIGSLVSLAWSSEK